MKSLRQGGAAFFAAALLLTMSACGGSSPSSTKASTTSGSAGKSATSAASSSPASSSSPKAPIRIAWIGGLTGILAQDALNAKRGTQMAVAYVNAHGGILGRKVAVSYDDTGTNPQKARQTVQREILSNHVAGIVGDYYTPNCLAYLPVIDQYHVPSVAYDCSADKVVNSGSKYMFRTDEGNKAADDAIAIYAYKNMHDKRFVSLGGNNGYAEGNIKDFDAEVKALGGTVVGVQTYNPASTKDFTPFLEKFKGKHVNAFFLGGSPAPNALIIKQARANGFKQDIVSSTGIDRQIIWNGAGQAAVGATMVIDTPGIAANGAQYMTAKQRAWLAQWNAKYHDTLGIYDAGHAYDATMLLLGAIQKAGTTSGPAVRKAILALGQNYKGVVSNFTLMQNGDPHQNLFVMNWQKDGKLHIIKELPESAVYGNSKN